MQEAGGEEGRSSFHTLAYFNACQHTYAGGKGEGRAKFIPNLLGLAVAERKRTRLIRRHWQVPHMLTYVRLAALHEVLRMLTYVKVY